MFKKTARPEETIARIKEGFKRLGLDEEFTIAHHFPNAYSTHMRISDLGVFSNGKGLSEELSVASAYGEMVERLSAGLQNFEQQPFKQYYGLDSIIKSRFDTYQYLPGYVCEHEDAIPNAIRVEDLLGHLKHLKKADLEFIRDESELTRHWVDGYSLLNDRQVKVPLMLVRWISATNGLASGNTMEEAILHGSYECIERYATIKAVRDKMIFPTIIYDTINVDYLKELMNTLYQSGVEFHIKEMSMDLSMYITGVVFINHNVPEDCLEHMSIKVGCASDTEEALARCFTERLQGANPVQEGMAPTYITPEMKEDYLPIFFKGYSPKPLEMMKLGTQINFERGDSLNTGTELTLLKSTCESLDTDLIVVDQTHPVLQFPTVRVIMPGISDSMRYWSEKSLTKEMISNTSKEDNRRDTMVIKLMRSFSEEASNPASAG